MMRARWTSLVWLPLLIVSAGACANCGDNPPGPGAANPSSGSAGSNAAPGSPHQSSGGPGTGSATGTTGTSGASGSGAIPDGGDDLDDEFEGAALDGAWTVLNGEQVATSVSGGVLRMTPNRHCVWFHADEGPGLVKLVTGDFKVTANVRARRASRPSQPAPGVYQFAGLIARDPAGSSAPENYVFSVMGERGGWLTNETKNTINDSSDVHGPNEGRKHADAELRVCRVGQVFRLYNRPPTGGRWKLESTYDRSNAPLPQTLQVGPIAYTYTSSPDLVGEFDYVRFRPVSSVDDCATD